jgi:DNA repair exonuclease SbcCD ATPase subunit
MDLIQSIWLSTVAGAGLFLGAGYVAGKGLSSKAADGGSADLLQAEKDARQQAEARAAALEQQQTALTQSLEGERSRAQDGQNARSEAQKLREQLGQLQAELNKARTAAAGPSPAEAQLRQENADMRQRLSAAEQASQAYATERARAQDLEQKLAAAMAQSGAANGGDAQRLAAVQMELQSAQAQLRDARTQADQLRAGAQRADQLAAENAQLRTRSGGSDKLSAELATEKAKVAQLQTQVAAFQKTAENTGKLAADLTTEKTKVRELEQKLAAAQKSPGDAGKLVQELAAEKAKVQQLQAQIATLQQAANEAARLGLDLANARSKVNELEAKLAKAPAGGANPQELDRMRGENNTLRGELDLMKRTAIAQKDHDALKKTNNELSLRMRTLEQRASETDYYANENSDLRRRLEELEAIALEAKQMRRRITDLEAQAFALTAAKTKDKGAAGKPAVAQVQTSSAGGEKRLEQLLEEAMAVLVRDETGGRAVVLADTRGLLLAAAGEAKYQNELAAAASVVAEVAEKVRALLPFAEPQTLLLSDVNNVIVKTRWLRIQDDTLALSVLGFSDDLPDPTEDKVARTVTKLMTYD